jgi:hypothetical protein
VERAGEMEAQVIASGEALSACVFARGSMTTRPYTGPDTTEMVMFVEMLLSWSLTATTR